MGSDLGTNAIQLPEPDATLEWLDAAPADGMLCALLTPAIRAKLREMTGGQVLEVRVDDLLAQDDIAFWCRLSGNTLLAMVEQETPHMLRAFVQKKVD